MLPKQLLDQAQSKINQTVTHYNEELKKLRTGRAHPSMLDGVQVKAYGVVMPLNQVGNVLAPEPQSLQITPFDPTNIQAISEAIRSDQSLGLNPSDDGRVVRIPIPALTTERRQQIVKQLNEKAEEAHIACRNVRHDILGLAKQAKNDKTIGEDDYSRLEKQIDELMASTKVEIEKAAKVKEQEIMTV
jgi:ribosome recycling factor